MRAHRFLVAPLALLAAACAPAAKAPSAAVAPAPVGVAAATSAGASGVALLSQADADPKAELPALAALAKSGPTRAAFPQADSFVAVQRDDVSLAKDGSVVERHKSIVRILDAQRGKERFADVRIPWDRDRQTLAVVLARTVNPDGVAHDVSDDETGDIVPPELAEATVYSSALQRVVSFPAVDEGSVLELVWTRTTKLTADASLGGELALAIWDPQQTRIVTLTVPKGAAGRFAVEGTTLAPSEADDAAAGTHTWTWTEKDVPDRQPEPGTPAAAEALPRLLYTFEPDWKSATSKMAEHYHFDAASVSAPVKAEADRLVAGKSGDAARAQAIFRFVAQDIRMISLDLGLAGYSPNPPEKVLENRYADVRDKVALLLALCAAEKIDGQAVLGRTGGVPVVVSVPTLAQFDHLVARVSIDGHPVWLDPSSHDAQFGVEFVGEDNFVLPLGADAPEHRALPDPAMSISKSDETYTVDESGNLDASVRYAATGWFADIAIGSLRPFKGDRLAQRFQQATGEVSATAIDKGHSISDLTSVTGPVEITHLFSAPAYAPAQGTFRVIELPPRTMDFLDDLPSTGMTHRDYPLVVSPPRTLQRTITVKLPSGWKVAWLPPALDGEDSGLRYHTSCDPKDGAVTCRSEITLDTKEIPPAQYPAFHAALAKLDQYRQRVILLTR